MASPKDQDPTIASSDPNIAKMSTTMDPDHSDSSSASKSASHAAPDSASDLAPNQASDSAADSDSGAVDHSDSNPEYDSAAEYDAVCEYDSDEDIDWDSGIESGSGSVTDYDSDDSDDSDASVNTGMGGNDDNQTPEQTWKLFEAHPVRRWKLTYFGTKCMVLTLALMLLVVLSLPAGDELERRFDIAEIHGWVFRSMIASALLIAPLVAVLLLWRDLYCDITEMFEEVPVDEGYNTE
jgi:hypothetical protein